MREVWAVNVNERMENRLVRNDMVFIKND